MKLTFFEALVITHLVIDFIFQWKWQALNKTKNWLALFSHCLIYGIGFIPVFLIYKINFFWLILLFVSHSIIDQGKFKNWLLESFKGIAKKDVSETEWDILLLGVDQILHLIILVVIIIL
jgi:hypothetical protein